MTTPGRRARGQRTVAEVAWPPPARRHVQRSTADAGMATAEYAVATLAACGFAGLLVAVLSGGEVQEMLLSIVRRALTLE